MGQGQQSLDGDSVRTCGFAESLIARTEQAYWDYALARQQIEIVAVSLELAEQQLMETEERIKIGTLAEIELAAAKAEIALRVREPIYKAEVRVGEYRKKYRVVSPTEVVKIGLEPSDLEAFREAGEMTVSCHQRGKEESDE